MKTIKDLFIERMTKDTLAFLKEHPESRVRYQGGNFILEGLKCLRCGGQIHADPSFLEPASPDGREWYCESCGLVDMRGKPVSKKKGPAAPLKVLLDLRQDELSGVPLALVNSRCAKCHGKVFVRMDKPSSYDPEDKYLYCPKCGELERE
jgi:DNA-directed RNA polymerase subunit RPC12/RpoP